MQLDDLIIMGDTKEELEQNIRLILARLDKYELKIAIHKCDFDCNSSIEFLGHTICDGKISPGPKSSKILEGIVFIGIANWFAKYIPDCQRRLRPLLDARIDGWHDASKDGYFCVLFEDTGIGDACDRLRVIAYAGGVFRGPQLAWSILQKEMHAVYQAHLAF